MALAAVDEVLADLLEVAVAAENTADDLGDWTVEVGVVTAEVQAALGA